MPGVIDEVFSLTKLSITRKKTYPLAASSQEEPHIVSAFSVQVVSPYPEF